MLGPRVEPGEERAGVAVPGCVPVRAHVPVPYVYLNHITTLPYTYICRKESHLLYPFLEYVHMRCVLTNPFDQQPMMARIDPGTTLWGRRRRRRCWKCFCDAFRILVRCFTDAFQMIFQMF